MVSLGKIANFIGKFLIPFNNKRVVCPPGKIRPGQGTLVVVPTVMRSGTHLLIDTIINNFSCYRRTPLYVDLDRMLDRSEGRKERIQDLLGGGNYVVKTHFPQVDDDPSRLDYMLQVFEHGKIVTVHRDVNSVVKSALAWGLLRKSEEGEYRLNIDKFNNYWKNYDLLSLEFEELVDYSLYPGAVAKIGNYLRCQPRSQIIRSISKKRPFAVYLAKASTRFFGRYAPIINTTINFNNTNSSNYK